MAADDIRTTKVLCHRDGALFANYHPAASEKGYVHAIYLCSEAEAPDPTTLDIVPSGVTDVSTLVWFELEAYVSPIRTREQVAGKFNYTTGEDVA